MTPELSVIIPAYHEEESIGRTVSGTLEFLKGHAERYEVIVVDDGSRDRTGSIVRTLLTLNPQLRLIEQPVNQGKGMAVKTGIAAAKYSRCLFMDADGATSITEWPAFDRAMNEGACAVHASRHLPGSVIAHPQPLMRRVLGAGYRWLCRVLFGHKVTDYNCGFKAYQTVLAQKIYGQIEMKDWTFDVEAIIRLKNAGVDPVELPVRWNHCEKKASLDPLGSALGSLRSLIRLRRTMKSLRGPQVPSERIRDLRKSADRP